MKVLTLLFPAGVIEEGQMLVSEICKKGAQAEFVRADVRLEEDVRNLIDKTVARYGRLDVAVNAAGTEGMPGPWWSEPPRATRRRSIRMCSARY